MTNEMYSHDQALHAMNVLETSNQNAASYGVNSFFRWTGLDIWNLPPDSKIDASLMRISSVF